MSMSVKILLLVIILWLHRKMSPFLWKIHTKYSDVMGHHVGHLSKMVCEKILLLVLNILYNFKLLEIEYKSKNCDKPLVILFRGEMMLVMFEKKHQGCCVDSRVKDGKEASIK